MHAFFGGMSGLDYFKYVNTCDGEMGSKVVDDISTLIVNTKALADSLEMTQRHVNRLANDGILLKRAPGRYPLYENIKRYIRYIKSGQADDDEKEATKRYWEERALHEAAKRKMAELKLAQLNNQLHDADTVELVMTDMLTTFKNRLLALPQKVSPKIIGLKNIAEVNDILATEINETLTELSDYSPDLFSKGGESSGDDESDNEDVLEDSESNSSTTEANGKSMGGSV